MDHVGSRSGGVGLRCGYEWISLVNTCLGIHEGLRDVWNVLVFHSPVPDY